MTRWLERSQPYLPHVRRVFTKYGLPQDLVLLPFTESGYNVRAYSWAGAGGMWQFMKGTGRLYGLKADWWIDDAVIPTNPRMRLPAISGISMTGSATGISPLPRTMPVKARFPAH